MGKSKILVTGAGGQVGRALARLAPDLDHADRGELDVTDRAAVTGAVGGHSVVVHLAAFTHVDACETDPGTATKVNTEGTRNVVEAAAAAAARVVYLSTDYVFDGNKSTEYTEVDETNPINVYGRTKLAGEDHVLGSNRNLVVRTSWVVGDGRNFVRTILEAATSRTEVSVVDDQRGRPTFARDLAVALMHLINEGTAGLVHVAGDGDPCTWADLAELALAETGSDTVVRRISTSDFSASSDKVVAPRPPDSSLALGYARQLGVPLRDWRSSLHDYVGGL